MMKKQKWKRWLLWIGGSVALLLCIGYFGMDLAVSYVLKSMTPQLPSASSQTQSQESPSPIDTLGPSRADSDKHSDEETVQVQPSTDKQAVTPSSNSMAQSVTTPTGSSPDTGAAAVTSPLNSNPPSPTPKPKQQALNYEAQVTTEKAKVVEESISLKEKAAVSAVLLKKLSASELQLFAKMAGNGMSVEEKKQAKEMVLKKLTEDEYNQLIQIATKYGLSQGMNYKDSQKQVQTNK
ncbi:hypothetical protein GC102_25135 [Paenibacillus sp. LMG 31460]|uniref:Uncharacterized protein n=1 Tax=Paenibacillus germinis TaxID=2654979 RepID=A0ABX1Z760_9BACL|nr:hypothetical protein [Paenibacillus germinis]NOU89007.1 hypothetical protein [Paenibacillus germinis]